MKRILYVIILGLISILGNVVEGFAETKGYKIIGKTAAVYPDMSVDPEKKDNSKILIEVQKGDTVEAARGTEDFIAERIDSGFTMLPVVYKGVKGYMNTSNLIPVKLSETDSITRIPDRLESEMTGLERSLAKYQDRVLNLSIHPLEWLRIGIWSLLLIVVLFIIRRLKPKFVQNCAIFILIALILASISEVMYIIGMGDKALFFIDADYVGTWRSRFNFILLAVGLVCQFVLISFMDDTVLSFRVTPSHDADPDFRYLSASDPKWTRKFIVFYADFFLLGLIILTLVNGFLGDPLGIWAFLSLFAVLIFPIIAFIRIGRPIRGVIAELMFFILTVGFVFMMAILGTKMLWLIAVLIGGYFLLLLCMPGNRR